MSIAGPRRYAWAIVVGDDVGIGQISAADNVARADEIQPEIAITEWGDAIRPDADFISHEEIITAGEGHTALAGLTVSTDYIVGNDAIEADENRVGSAARR